MRATGNRPHFEEHFEDSQANFSEVGRVSEGPAGYSSGGEPLQLLKIQPHGRIQLNQEALGLIASVEGPVGFVAVAGKTRSGKSCLLNRILKLSGTGFQVDPSYSSCTKGIWIWSEPEFNSVTNNYIFFIDTEGSDSLEKDFDNDTKIFTLALLISSYFIYNSIGSIDERSLAELQMVTALGHQIRSNDKISERENQQSLYKFMPKFMWVLRDFTLNIEDEKHNKISATTYLQNCLTDQGRTSHEDSRKIKKSIVNYFKDRQCMTLVRPVNEERDLQRLNTLPDFSLRAQFQQGVKALRDKILQKTGPKAFEGEAITGPAMASMIENYVQAFNSGRIPSIKSAWEQLAEDEGAAAFNRALQKYEQVVHQQFPTDEPKGAEIYSSLARLREETLKEFQKQSYGNNNQDYEKKLKDLLKQKELNIIEINNDINQERNKQILKKVANRLKLKMESDAYLGKSIEFKKDLDEVIRSYNKEAKGENKGELLTEFISSITPYMMKLEGGQAQHLKEEKQREQIRNRELEKKLNMQKKQLQNAKIQMKAKDDALMAERKALQQQRKNKGSCCQIM